MNSAADLLYGGVSPFGHPRINDRSHLPAALLSVPRPSSPLGAKASTGRPYHPPARTSADNQQQHQPTNAIAIKSKPLAMPRSLAAAKPQQSRSDQEPVFHL